MNILITDVTYFSFLDEKFEKDVNIFIKDGKIAEIFSKTKEIDIIEKKYGIDFWIDGQNKILLPGLVNAHMHFYGAYSTGISDVKQSSNFKEVLENLWWKLDKSLNEDAIKYSTLHYIENAIKHGTTTIIDHHASPKAVKNSLKTIAEIAFQSGIRLSTCYEVSDRDGNEITEEGIQENIEFIKYSEKQNSQKIVPLFGLHASFTLSDDTLRKIQNITKGLNIGFHIHVAEDKIDEEDAKKRGYKSAIDRLNKFGITNDKSIFAHCVHISDEEIKILKETGTMVVNNPQSNMNNAVGIANIKKLQDNGVLVGLGSDGMTVNMFEELRTALWQQHIFNGNPNCCFIEVCNMLFKNNYLIANRLFKTKLGYIKKGCEADLILMNYIPHTPLTEKNILGHLVFGISQELVDTTIVDGKILMYEKQIVNKNLYEKKKESVEVAKDVWKNFKKFNL
jgi:putative selenium metabolism protein SsnA